MAPKLPQRAAPPPKRGDGAVTSPREARQAKTTWRAAPSSIRGAISRGDEVDYGALMTWHATHCPARLAHLSPDVAAILSGWKQLATGALPTIGIVWRD